MENEKAQAGEAEAAARWKAREAEAVLEAERDWQAQARQARETAQAINAAWTEAKHPECSKVNCPKGCTPSVICKKYRKLLQKAAIKRRGN